MDINNEEFRKYLLYRLQPNWAHDYLPNKSSCTWNLVTGQWSIELVDGWGIKNNAGFTTIHRINFGDIYSFTTESSYYEDICKDFRNSKIDKIIC